MGRSVWSWIDLGLCQMIAARYEMKLFRRQKKFFHNKLPQVAFSDDCSWHNRSQLAFRHFFHFVFSSLCLYVFLFWYPFASFAAEPTNPFREISPVFCLMLRSISFISRTVLKMNNMDDLKILDSESENIFIWVLLCCTTIPPIHRALTAVFVAESQGRST